ncbi:putative transferase CAF17 homolog, mitochondrial [Uranotaenia lowii]|uniref:putative transferase CAF17 homolog, mitochondrial n=1 Tax=Uranotaenia lowii TaxID=190385 RepID=UPI00247A0FC8|nr:putative transferase CAF17 homolog, mitochondrial [Uranotaenia lowii]
MLLRPKKLGGIVLNRVCNSFNSNYGTQSKPPSMVLERLNSRVLIGVHGEDASVFLQGLITNDMNHFEHRTASIYAHLLNTSGRVLFDSLIYKSSEDNRNFLVECDTEAVDKVRKHLRIFRVRKKVDISDVDKKVWVMFSSISNGCTVPADDTQPKLFKLFKDARLSDLGYRIITDSVTTSSQIQSAFSVGFHFENDAISYKEHRYKLGIPEGIKELPLTKCFPLESNCDYMHGVSFHKGCYIGQELTARTYHTGTTRKRIMPLFFKESVPDLPENASIENSEGQLVGKLKGVKRLHGLGLLRLEHVLPSYPTLIVDGKYSCQTQRPKWWPKEHTKSTQH